ncbi:hypothetical protein BB561_005630 [Smittium simulii]|uniref:Uncharacterized protein n=1 Tax=Smittium simulii TaxID=133385 RepID=A0A2T9Y9G2_9FUNG|nr:hypothetical protein BB561_005630 [Smittium simulii]
MNYTSSIISALALFLCELLVLKVSARGPAISVTVDVLDPFIDPEGQVYVVTEAFSIPDIYSFAKNALESNIFYTADNITLSGWSPTVLDFSKGITGSSENFPGVFCTDCDRNSDFSLPINKIQNMGLCSGGWCRFKTTDCYYNIKNNFWYLCKPVLNRNSNNISETPTHSYYVRVYTNRIEVKNLDTLSIVTNPIPMNSINGEKKKILFRINL